MSTQPETGSAWIPDDSTFGARLALIRHGKRWNEKEAALACGFPYSSWRRWESGSTPHNIVEVAAQIASRTGADEDWILRGRRAAQGTAKSPRPDGPRGPWDGGFPSLDGSPGRTRTYKPSDVRAA